MANTTPKKYEEEDIVLCTVTRVEPTVIFVRIEDNGEGTIITSEIAPGRIKNLREYVTVNKKIVCKILRIKGNHIDLSLRRVSSKEKEEVMKEYKKEQTAKNVLKTVLKDKAKNIIEKISKKEKILEFLEKAKENPKLLEKFCTKQEIQTLSKILEKRKEKQAVVKKEFTIKSNASNGIKRIKKILETSKNSAEIKYLGSSKFTIKLKSKNLKQADHKLDEILEKIKQKTKKNDCEFNLK